MQKIFLIIILSFSTLLCQQSIMPVSTYSIVARDSLTGEMGVAVQSHWFSVGSVVTWAEAGVGVVATQSFVEVSYGPLGLELIRGGKTANQALEALLQIDENRDVRQVAMIDINGNVATHTGENCIREAGHYRGAQFSAQANMMEKGTVWKAMADAYGKTNGDLLEKLMRALEAAQNEGGDIRGRQSAAILIVPGEKSGQSWKDKIVDLRIEDHPEPIKEMRRLVKIHRAYANMNSGDEALANNKIAEAFKYYSKAAELYPESLEIKYWTAITLAQTGKVEEAIPLLKEIFEKDPNWIELTKRLPEAGLLPDDKELLEQLPGQ